MSKLANIKLTVWFFPNGFGVMKPNSYQEKTFKNFESLVTWCRNNYQKIGALNDWRTFGQSINHFDIMAALEGKSQ